MKTEYDEEYFTAEPEQAPECGASALGVFVMAVIIIAGIFCN